MSDIQYYRRFVDLSLKKIGVTINETIDNTTQSSPTLPLNSYKIQDVETEPNLTTNLLSTDDTTTVGLIDIVSYPTTSFVATVSPPLVILPPSTIEGIFTKIGTVYRGCIHITSFTCTTSLHTFTVDISPIKSTNFITEDQVSGMISMRAGTDKVQGNIRAVPSTTNILISIISDDVTSGVLFLSMIFN